MRHRRLPCLSPLALLLSLTLGATAPTINSQALTSTFTYQGELRESGSAANASYDMEFRLYNALSGGAQVGATQVVNGVAVANGLFSVALDFGAAQFAGDRQWLEIRVRRAGTGSFETLAPRSEVTATPYAWGSAAALANSVTTTSIVDGSVGTADIDAAQVQRRVAGNCSGIQGVQSVAQDGSVVCASFGTVTGVSAGTGLSGGGTGGSFALGIATGGVGADQIDSSQVQRRVTGQCAVGQYLRVVNQDGSVICGNDPVGAPAWLLGGNGGTNPASHFVGTTDGQPLELRAANQRMARFEARLLTGPAGGFTANVLLGSPENLLRNGVRGATIAGGGARSGNSDPDFGTAGPNEVNVHYGTVGGGYANRAGDSNASAIDNAFATVGGGQKNAAEGFASAVSGGSNNLASSTFGTVSGGVGNIVSGYSGTIGGGDDNLVNRDSAVVSGGSGNVGTGYAVAVGGGAQNTARGAFAAVPGGLGNCAGGDYSWAGGRSAKVRPAVATTAAGCNGVAVGAPSTGDAGTFVWADSQNQAFTSSGSNQFLVRAQNGAAINTNSPVPGAALTVSGSAAVSSNVAVGSTDLDAARLHVRGPGGAGNYIGMFSSDSDVQLGLRSTSAGGRLWSLQSSRGDDPNPSLAGTFQIVDRTAGLSRFRIDADGNTFNATGVWGVPSDVRLKTGIRGIDSPLQRLLALRGHRFEYRDPAAVMARPGPRMGFIAQEVQETLPEWVSETADGWLAVSPIGFEALTVEAIRELRHETTVIDDALAQRIDALQQENAELRKELAAFRRDLAELRALQARRGDAPQ